jgi:heptosyltransferase II
MKTVLVIRLGAMGDIVLATAVLEGLRRRYPGASLDFVCKARFAGLFAGDPRLRRVIGFDERAAHRGLRGLLLFCHQLRHERYDCVIDLQGNPRSRMIARGIHARRRLSWPKDTLRRRMLVHGLGRARQYASVIARYLATLAPLGIDAANARPKLYPHRDPSVALPARPFIAVAPGAHWPTKRWPSERYAELIGRIGNAKWDIVLVGDRGDTAAAAAIAGAVPFAVRDLSGKLTLPQLVWTLSRAALVVSNDTGAMHIAEACGVPVIALFGPTVRDFGFAPWRRESVVIERELSCRPCSLHGAARCPKGHHRCLREITPDDVYRAIKPVLLKHLSLLLFS